MAKALLRLGRTDQAHRQIVSARDEFAQAEDLQGLAQATNVLGELARQAGALDEARRHYQRAYDIYEEIGARDMAVTAFNLALAEFQSGAYSQAAVGFRRTAAQTVRVRDRRMRYLAHCGILAVAAVAGDSEAFDASLALITGELSDLEFVEPDVAYLLTRAGEVASDAKPERAAPVLVLARQQWAALDDERALARVEGLLERLI